VGTYLLVAAGCSGLVWYGRRWLGLWMEMVEGVSLENLVRLGNPMMHPNDLLHILHDKINKTQVSDVQRRRHAYLCDPIRRCRHSCAVQWVITTMHATMHATMHPATMHATMHPAWTPGAAVAENK
jgi:hypothetical protein